VYVYSAIFIIQVPYVIQTKCYVITVTIAPQFHRGAINLQYNPEELSFVHIGTSVVQPGGTVFCPYWYECSTTQRNCLLSILARVKKFHRGRNRALAFATIHKQPFPLQRVVESARNRVTSSEVHRVKRLPISLECAVSRVALHLQVCAERLRLATYHLSQPLNQDFRIPFLDTPSRQWAIGPRRSAD
jgi:hypothetical protein